jgi:glycosyltransferase involved in cell wall biosynthesis
MKTIATRVMRHLGVEVRRVQRSTAPRLVELPASGHPARGTVLLAFILEPFLLQQGEQLSTGHTNVVESLLIAKVLREMGYAVDVIDYHDKAFVPSKDYSILISSRVCMARLAALVGPGCLKIVYVTVSHWLRNNSAVLARCREVLERRKVALSSYKQIEENYAIESADFAIFLASNDFSLSSYQYAGKPYARVPLCTQRTYDWPDGKDFEAVRRKFIWLGSQGFVHKGLDLVLEAFAAMPEYHLTVCGPIHMEPDFDRAFAQELHRTKNIETLGWVDISSEAFVDLAAKHVGLVYPSCAEGTSGGVLTCMQAGLIPVVTYESGIDVGGGRGVMIEALTVEAVRAAVEQTAAMPEEELQAMARRAWQSARDNHTLERFSEEFRKAVELALATVQPATSPGGAPD